MAKSFLLVTLMSLNVGYGPLIEGYQRQAEDAGLNPLVLNSVSLTEVQAQGYYQVKEQERRDNVRCVPAGLPPATLLARHLSDVTVNSSIVVVVKDSDLKMYHVMSVKQSLQEDLSEHSYQCSCRAAEWSSMSFGQVLMQFEPLELHVAEALGQQDLETRCL